MEPVTHLRHPLQLNASWCDHDNSSYESAGLQFGDDQAGLNGLAETDLVGEQQTHGILVERAAEYSQLVWQRIEVRPAFD
jgi:hypothetical protein